MKNKDYLKESVHLVGSSTHCNVMHGTYNIKLTDAQQTKGVLVCLLYISTVCGHYQDGVAPYKHTKYQYFLAFV